MTIMAAWINVALVVVVSLSCAFAVPLFGSQIHSYNDLREWSSLYRKGAEWLKIDMNYQPPSWCTARAVATERVRDGAGGCFVLNHDDPTLIRSSPYNTSDDVIAIAADATAHNRTLNVALCFKYSIPDSRLCGDDSNATMWRALVDRFYTRAMEYNRSVTFILDGAGTPDDGVPCLKQRWRPWVATYIPYSNAPAAFTSDNRTAAYDRFAVLNMQYQTFGAVSARHYGKFNEEPYPFLVWEPSDQSTQLAIASAYVANGYTHKDAFRFAINIDPLQLEVYLGSVSERAWNTRTALSSAAVAPRAAHAITVDGGTNVLALTYFDERTRTAAFAVYTFDYLLSALTLRQNATAIPPALQLSPRYVITAIIPFTVHPDPYVLIANAALQFAVVSVRSVSDWSTLNRVVTSGQFTLSCDSTVEYAATLYNGSRLLITVSCVNEESELVAQVYTLDCSGTWRLRPIAQPQPLLFANPVDNWSIATHFASPLDRTACAADELAVVLVHSFNLVASVSSSCYDISAGRYRAITEFSEIAVGGSPTLSIRTDPESSRSYALLVLTNGYCFNNEVDNKRPAPALCDSQPTALSGVLTYTIAPLSEWTTAKAVDMVHSCNHTVLHGMFDQGTAPHAVLIQANDANGRPSLGLIEVHRGMTQSDTPAPQISDGPADAALCGLATPYDGLIIDSFKLPLPAPRDAAIATS